MVSQCLESLLSSTCNIQMIHCSLAKDIKQAVVFKWILRCFETWSGLKHNFHKSSLFWLGERSFLLSFIIHIFGCKEEDFPLKYLGVPLSPNKLKRMDWTPLLESFERKLEGWKENLLSLGEGKFTISRGETSLTKCCVIGYTNLYDILSPPNGC